MTAVPFAARPLDPCRPRRRSDRMMLHSMSPDVADTVATVEIGRRRKSRELILSCFYGCGSL